VSAIDPHTGRRWIRSQHSAITRDWNCPEQPIRLGSFICADMRFDSVPEV
jgi:hypothetical protein